MTSQSAPPEAFVEAYMTYFGVTEQEARDEWDADQEDSEFSHFWRAAQAAAYEDAAKIAEEFKQNFCICEPGVAPHVHPDAGERIAYRIRERAGRRNLIAAAIRAAAGEEKR